MFPPSTAFALIALVIYGSTQVIAKAAVMPASAPSMVAMNFVVSLPVYLFLFCSALMLWGQYAEHLLYVVYGLIGASTARGGYYIYLEALERGAVSIVGSITAAFPALTALLAVTVLGESLAPVNAAGIALIIGGMAVLSYTHQAPAGRGQRSRSSLVLSVMTFLVWGVGGIFIKLALEGLPLIAYLGLYVFVLPPVAGVYLRHKRVPIAILRPTYTLPVIGGIVVAELWQLGYFAETSALSHGAASVVFPLVSAYPIVTILGARLFLNERLSPRDWCVLCAVILGILLVSLP